MFLLLHSLERWRFYSPDNTGAIDGPGNELTVDAIERALEVEDDESINLDEKIKGEREKERIEKKEAKQEKTRKDDKLTDKDEKPDLSDEKEDEEETDEDEEALKELEEELDEEEEPDEEKLEIVAPPRRQEVLKKYPEFFKDFPQYERILYREKQFTEIFPTPAEAKEAAEVADSFGKFESDILAGDLTSVLQGAKNAKGQSFAKLVDNFLPALNKVDESAYVHLASTVIRNTIEGAFRNAKENNDEELRQACATLHKFIFNTTVLSKPQPLAKPEDTREKELAEREERILEERFNGVQDDITGRTDNSLKRTIDQYMDPKNLMSEFTKRNAVRQALEDTKDIIAKDTRFKQILDKLWERAFKDNFSSRSVAAIESAFKTKAKTVLPQVIIKTQREALKGLKGRASEKDDPPLRGPIKEKRQDSRSSRSQDDKGQNKKPDIPKGMSTYEYLSQD